MLLNCVGQKIIEGAEGADNMRGACRPLSSARVSSRERVLATHFSELTSTFAKKLQKLTQARMALVSNVKLLASAFIDFHGDTETRKSTIKRVNGNERGAQQITTLDFEVRDLVGGSHSYSFDVTDSDAV